MIAARSPVRIGPAIGRAFPRRRCEKSAKSSSHARLQHHGGDQQHSGHRVFGPPKKAGAGRAGAGQAVRESGPRRFLARVRRDARRPTPSPNTGHSEDGSRRRRRGAHVDIPRTGPGTAAGAQADISRTGRRTTRGIFTTRGYSEDGSRRRRGGTRGHSEVAPPPRGHTRIFRGSRDDARRLRGRVAAPQRGDARIFRGRVATPPRDDAATRAGERRSKCSQASSSV